MTYGTCLILTETLLCIEAWPLHIGGSLYTHLKWIVRAWELKVKPERLVVALFHSGRYSTLPSTVIIAYIDSLVTVGYFCITVCPASRTY